LDLIKETKGKYNGVLTPRFIGKKMFSSDEIANVSKKGFSKFRAS